MPFYYSLLWRPPITRSDLPPHRSLCSISPDSRPVDSPHPFQLLLLLVVWTTCPVLSYQAHDYTIMEPRPWSIFLSSSDVNPFISHGDIPPTIQTPASSVTMESAFSLERFSTIAADLDYVLLLGQPLPEFLCTAWHISSRPAPSVPLILSQHVLLVSPVSCTYFGHLKSIIRLGNSYLVVSVSPESSAYGPFIPESCHIHLPSSFVSLPWTHRICDSCFTFLLSRNKHG